MPVFSYEHREALEPVVEAISVLPQERNPSNVLGLIRSTPLRLLDLSALRLLCTCIRITAYERADTRNWRLDEKHEERRALLEGLQETGRLLLKRVEERGDISLALQLEALDARPALRRQWAQTDEAFGHATRVRWPRIPFNANGEQVGGSPYNDQDFGAWDWFVRAYQLEAARNVQTVLLQPRVLRSGTAAPLFPSPLAQLVARMFVTKPSYKTFDSEDSHVRDAFLADAHAVQKKHAADQQALQDKLEAIAAIYQQGRAAVQQAWDAWKAAFKRIHPEAALQDDSKLFDWGFHAEFNARDGPLSHVSIEEEIKKWVERSQSHSSNGLYVGFQESDWMKRQAINSALAVLDGSLCTRWTREVDTSDVGVTPLYIDTWYKAGPPWTGFWKVAQSVSPSTPHTTPEELQAFEENRPYPLSETEARRRVLTCLFCMARWAWYAFSREAIRARDDQHDESMHHLRDLQTTRLLTTRQQHEQVLLDTMRTQARSSSASAAAAAASSAGPSRARSAAAAAAAADNEPRTRSKRAH